MRAPSKKHRQKGRAEEQHAKTADDYLSQGVELEEAAEKWRGGDSKKSARFYVKAIDAYEAGLTLFPRSFDLLYNKARALFTVTQYPPLVLEFPLPLRQLLHVALAAHRAAFETDKFNSDLLFNLAQVLTSLADDSIGPPSPVKNQDPDSELSRASLLEEALTHFNTCYSIQWDELSKRQLKKRLSSQFESAEMHATGSADEDVADVRPEQSSIPIEAWAMIEEPITADTLADTAIAMSDALINLCELTPSADTERLKRIEQLCQTLERDSFSKPFAELAENTRVALEVAIATLKVKLFESAFEASHVTVEAYGKRLDEAFSSLTADEGLTKSPVRDAYVEALVSFAQSTSGCESGNMVRWSCLERALEVLAMSSTSSTTIDMSDTLLRRADVEMLRFSISFANDMPSSLANDQVRTVLATNAEKYYRGAKAYAVREAAGKTSEQVQTAHIRELVARCISKGGGSPLRELRGAGIPDDAIREEIDAMTSDLSLPQTILTKCGLA